MSYNIYCPNCQRFSGCICHKLQLFKRFFGKTLSVMCHYCGHEWEQNKDSI